MERTMKTAIMTALNKIEFTEREIPKPKDNEVLVKLEYIGVCGSDLHYYEHGAIGNFIVKTPFVLGHECAGTVVEIGSKVKELKVGDRVALEPGKTCGECEFCRKGKYNLCKDVIFFATPPVDGVFQEYVAHPENLSFKLPDKLSTMEGALIEPLSVGMHAAMQGNAKIGEIAFVTGAGCIGLCSMLSLKACGISKVYVIDVMKKRLDKALELGAAGIIDASKEDVVKKAYEFTNGKGSDLTIETAGVESITNQAIEFAKKGSTIVLVGYSKTGMINMNVGMALDKELTFKTVFRYRHIFPLSIDAVESGAINIKNIVTNTYDFKDLQKAMDDSVKDKANIVKTVIKM